MSIFEFISVLISVIIGLGIVHLLKGIGGMFEQRQQARMYWVHLVWVAAVFFYMTSFWWFLYRWSFVEEWPMYQFLFVILYALLVYLLAAALFPGSGNYEQDYRQRFNNNRIWFFSVWLATGLIDLVDTNLKIQAGLSGWGGFYTYIMTVSIGGAVLSLFTRNEYVHGVFGVLWVTNMSIFWLMAFGVIQ